MSRPHYDSFPLRRWAKLAAFAPMLVLAAYVVWANSGWATWAVAPLIAFFSATALLTIIIMAAGVYWRSFTSLDPARGRMICIIPAYNERTEVVHDTIRSVIDQTFPPEIIYVIDDGSPNPIVPYPDHPKVVWIRQENAGKRHAQANALMREDPDNVDFILTVDSDSSLEPTAAEHLLRSMSDHRVQAATGMILVRNWQTNWLTRIIDINVVSSCLMFRMFRSWFGMVTPTSGALALYRAEVVYDNLSDYLTSGTAGDDRRLSFYALLRGQVVGVPEAVVQTLLPSTIKGTFMQRMRWSKSAWQGTPFVVTNMSWPVLALYIYPLIFALVWPLSLTVIIMISFQNSTPVVLYGVAFWLVTIICMTVIYALYRPGFDWKTRLVQFTLAPVYAVVGLLILRGSAYWALRNVRSQAWHTREEAVDDEQAAPDPIHH